MDTASCKNCIYFVQHYILGSSQFVQINCGHCIFGQTKRKHPEAGACEHFVQGQRNQDAFVSREYLSKKLLDYICSLDLLPEIEEAGRE